MRKVLRCKFYIPSERIPRDLTKDVCFFGEKQIEMHFLNYEGIMLYLNRKIIVLREGISDCRIPRQTRPRTRYGTILPALWRSQAL